MPFIICERHFCFIMSQKFDNYIRKHALHNELIATPPANDLSIAVIIPALNEPDIFETLNSLQKCYPTRSSVETIILVNNSEDAPDDIKNKNREIYQQIQHWQKKASSVKITFHSLLMDNLPKKHAGAGLARKILMDEAIQRFNRTDHENGFIVSLDADTTVSKNYLADLEKTIAKNHKLNCIIFGFEHPLNSYTSGNHPSAIVLYELHLRYFKLALKYSGFPYYYSTIGSCFAVNAMAYIKQGGMNRRQAGEDFYFLHKIFPLGNVIDLPHIKVYPSDRLSNRVPFGTGPALRKIIDDGDFLTYSPESFMHLKQLFTTIKNLFNAQEDEINTYYNILHFSIQLFIPCNVFTEKITEINKNSISVESFCKRFFAWFDAFRIIKYLNFFHSTENRISIMEAAKKITVELGYKIDLGISELELLFFYRQLI